MTSNPSSTSQLVAAGTEPDVIIQEIKSISITSDFFESFKSNSAAHSDTSMIYNVDVFPNFIPILMTIMVFSLKHASALEYRANAKCSPATICMYHLAITYGFFLLNDLYIRKPPSAHARLWSTSSWRSKFAEFLSSLPVPEFLQTILSQFHSAHTDRTKNVRFVPTAAGFSHDHFFGRFFPINMFAAIHDCTASLPGNSTRLDIFRDVFSRALYSITNPAYTCYIPELIGIGSDRAAPTTLKYINSKLYQIFNEMFNPVLFRDFQKRSSLACLNLAPPSFASMNINAYDILFAATPSNVREITTVLNTIASVLKPSLGSGVTLGAFVSKPSGIAILKHGYSTFPLPTWVYNNQNNKATSFSTLDRLQLQTDAARATELNFLQHPAAAFPTPTAVRDLTFTTAALVVHGARSSGASRALENIQITRHWPWCLRSDADNQDVFPRHDSTDLIAFSDEDDVTPPVLVLDTDGDRTITAHLATLTGKIIESFELDGSTVPMPDSGRPLALQNSLFADSAIPYRYIIPGSDFYFRDPGQVYPPLTRYRPPPDNRLCASSLLHDRTKIMLPQLNTRVADAELPDTLPGMTQRPGANFIQYTQSFLGFKTANAVVEDNPQDDIPGMVTDRLYVWSPYTYSCCQADTDYDMDADTSQRYFLTNLRTLFGTDYNLVQVVHPYEAMPID